MKVNTRVENKETRAVSKAKQEKGTTRFDSKDAGSRTNRDKYLNKSGMPGLSITTTRKMKTLKLKPGDSLTKRTLSKGNKLYHEK